MIAEQGCWVPVESVSALPSPTAASRMLDSNDYGSAT